METNIILQGDCIKEMKKLEANSVDAIITDPPYGLEFMGKEWDNSGTTAIACLKLNRKFIGIEKEEEYVKMAEARIKPFMEQRKL